MAEFRLCYKRGKVGYAKNHAAYILRENDYKAKEEILGMILESANEKNTFVISTHMIDEIESFIDEAIFIKDGEVVRRMSVEEERMQSGKSVADIYLEIM